MEQHHVKNLWEREEVEQLEPTERRSADGQQVRPVVFARVDVLVERTLRDDHCLVHRGRLVIRDVDGDLRGDDPSRHLHALGGGEDDGNSHLRRHGGVVCAHVHLRDGDVVRQYGGLEERVLALRCLRNVEQRRALDFVPARRGGGFLERLLVETLHLHFARVRDGNLVLRRPRADEHRLVRRDEVARPVVHEVLDLRPRRLQELVQVDVRVEPAAPGEERQVIHRQQRPVLSPVVLDEDVLLALRDVRDVHVAVLLDDYVVHHRAVLLLDEQNLLTRQRRQLLLLEVHLPLARQSAVVIHGELRVHVPARRVHLRRRTHEVVQLDRALERLAEGHVERDLQLVVVHQDHVERRPLGGTAALGVVRVDAHRVQEPAASRVLVQAVQHAHLESELHFVQAADVDLVQPAFPDVRPHRGFFLVVLVGALDAVPGEPER